MPMHLPAQATTLDDAILNNAVSLPARLKDEPAKLKKKKVGPGGREGLQTWLLACCFLLTSMLVPT